MPRSILVTLLITLVLVMPGRSEAASLTVSPGRFILHDVEPGRSYDIYKETGLRLTIINDSDESETWLLTTYQPSGRGRWEKGYGEIPDARWCWFTEKEITVESKSHGYAHINLLIPSGEKYYNQHWVATLNVSGKPGAGGIGLAVDVRMQIETKSNSDINVRPAGLIGMKPSVVRFEEVIPGTVREASVTLFNNDDTAHSYSITSLFDDAEIKREKYLRQSYDEIPDRAWISRSDNIRIEAGGSAELDLKLKVPEDSAYFGKKWEDMVLIQPDRGRAEFVRVQVETTTGPDAID